MSFGTFVAVRGVAVIAGGTLGSITSTLLVSWQSYRPRDAHGAGQPHSLGGAADPLALALGAPLAPGAAVPPQAVVAGGAGGAFQAPRCGFYLGTDLPEHDELRPVFGLQEEEGAFYLLQQKPQPQEQFRDRVAALLRSRARPRLKDYLYYGVLGNNFRLESSGTLVGEHLRLRQPRYGGTEVWDHHSSLWLVL